MAFRDALLSCILPFLGSFHRSVCQLVSDKGLQFLCMTDIPGSCHLTESSFLAYTSVILSPTLSGDVWYCFRLLLHGRVVTSFDVARGVRGLICC